MLVCAAFVPSSDAARPIVTFQAFGASVVHRPQGVALGADGAVWFTNEEGHAIGRIDATGAIRMYTSPAIASPGAITAAPDGALWFVNGTNSIGRITTAGLVTVFSPPGIGTPNAIVTGPDGALWLTTSGKQIARLTTSGTATIVADPRMRGTYGITSGPDGAVWFTNYLGGSIGRVGPDGVVRFFADSRIRFPVGIVTGPDGALWFADDSGSIGRMTTDGSLEVFGSAATVGHPNWLVVGADGALWATDRGGSLVRITTGGVITRYADPSIAFPVGIAAGPGGTLWFANYTGNTIGEAVLATGLAVGEPAVRASRSTVEVRLTGSGAPGAEVSARVIDATTRRVVRSSVVHATVPAAGSFTLVERLRRRDIRPGRIYDVVVRAGAQTARVSFRG